MKATDHDLERMFKTHQEHSVAAACRAIYDAGIVKGMEIISSELSKPIVLGEVTLGGVSPVADVTAMVNHLLAVAHMVDAGPHDNWR